MFSIPGGQKLYEFRRGMKRSVHSSVSDKLTEGSRSRNVNTGAGQRQILAALASFAERKQGRAYQIEMSLCQEATLRPTAAGGAVIQFSVPRNGTIAGNRGRFSPFTPSFCCSLLEIMKSPQLSWLLSSQRRCCEATKSFAQSPSLDGSDGLLLPFCSPCQMLQEILS